MIKLGDIILSLSVFLVAVTLMLVMFFGGASGVEAVVTVDGKEWGRYPIETDIELSVKTEFGSNYIVIKNGSVSVEKADCPDGYCVSHIEVSKKGETIVCLPHKLVIEIVG